MFVRALIPFLSVVVYAAAESHTVELINKYDTSLLTKLSLTQCYLLQAAVSAQYVRKLALKHHTGLIRAAHARRRGTSALNRE